MNIMCIHINLDTAHSLLYSQYWERTSVTQFKYKTSDICAMHDITKQELTAILLTCPITLSNTYCSQCQQPYPIYSRSIYVKTYRYRNYNRNLACKNCQSNNKQNYAKLLDKLREKSLPRLDYFPYELSIQIYAGLQYLQKNYCRRLKKNSPRLGDISSSPNISKSILQALYIIGLIFPATTKDFQLIKQNPNSMSKVVGNINWQIIPDQEALQAFTNTIQIQFIDRSRSDYKFIHEALCYDVVYYECLQYLHYRLHHHKCTFSYAEGTRLVIQKGLSFFSVAQMYYLIYRAAKQGSTLGSSKEHAGKLSVRILEQLIEDHARNPHEITKYGRISSYPQSHINNILFDKVFQKSDCGFYEPLHKLLL